MICISSGHGKYVRGASGIIDEVDEARKVVEATAEHLRGLKADVKVYHDDISKSQSENLERIVDWHNSQTRTMDCSIHFNCYIETEAPMGVEVLYVSQSDLADNVSSAIAACCGLIDRGPKHRDDLYFLNNTEAPAILIEVAFVDSEADVEIYHEHFDAICRSIAEILSDNASPQTLPQVLFDAAGPCSWFGGPDDQGVDADEGLAFIYEIDDAPRLFLDEQPAGTTGLARRLDPARPYVACRWNYDVTPKTMLVDPHHLARVYAPKTGRTVLAWPADWGPHSETGRVADLSPGLLDKLGIDTDDDVEVSYPVHRRHK